MFFLILCSAILAFALLIVFAFKQDELSEKTSILATKKDELDAASKQWKSRVDKSDAVNFSVAGRMQQINEVHIGIPIVVNKTRKSPRAKKFKGKGDDTRVSSSTPTSPELDNLNNGMPFKRSISVPGSTGDTSSGSDTSLRSSGRKVSVARPDDFTFTNFYKTVEQQKVDAAKMAISIDDLDCISRDSRSLLVQKRTIKVQRRRVASKNPVKALAARSDIKNEYTEIITGVAEREKHRLNIEKLAKTSNKAMEALAGLASKEDFAAVSLKKATGPIYSFLPYKDLMLLLVKGRRHVQTRLVEPLARNINDGDSYVLVTPNAVYNYMGKYSNVIEQSRAADVASHIQQKGDMGCRTDKVITINPKKDSSKDLINFWRLLGASGSNEAASAGHPDEDEAYESHILNTNMIYVMENNELVPAESWGTTPKIEMLGSNKVLVFDFGSEMYVWSGKTAPMEDKKQTLSLAKEMWSEGYNYEDCDICPMNVAQKLGSREKEELPLKCEKRPDWALFAKVTQHRETILFKEKFLNWPDFSRIIKVKETEGDKNGDASFDIRPCEITSMVNAEYAEPDLMIEGTHLGRGKSYFDEEMRRNTEVATTGIAIWSILENTYESLESEDFGHFYDADTYIIKWQYRVTVTGRALGGKPSKHLQIGRDRCVYFCWLGRNASINEKGAAAIITVELDNESAPQIRVTQGSEPAAFLQLFNGKMVVHRGKRKDEASHKQRLFVSRGELEHETVLVEVPCATKSLRSKGSFVFLNTDTGKAVVWHGCKSPKHTKDVTKNLVANIKTNRKQFYVRDDACIEVDEIEEGDDDEFLESLEGGATSYKTLINTQHSFETTPKLFYFDSLTGVFKVLEILCPHRSQNTTPFPFLQSDLYSAIQPALFLLDNMHELWLWQGWWPEREDDSSDSSDQTGSGAIRWHTERRAAMQTALEYWKAKHDVDDAEDVAINLVWAGLEPLAFTNLFHSWDDKEDIAELNIKEGKSKGDVIHFEKVLAQLMRTSYPLDTLLQRPLPDGVDPTRLEIYLSSDDFFGLLSMSKSEFQKLPSWKQTAVKKEKGLF